jgi:transcription initiation factor TFIIIB Brf1 subunit/transcription initiation factor TFIIB
MEQQINDLLDFVINEKKSMKFYKDKDKNFCHCGNQEELITNESIVCINCGFVLDNTILSDEKEWGSFGNEDNNTGVDGNRCGGPVDDLIPKMSLSTMISGNGNIQRLNMWLSMSYDEKVMMDLRKRISNIVIVNSLPVGVTKETMILFKKLINSKNSKGKEMSYRGKIRDGLIATCLYHSCKEFNCNLLASSLTKMFEISNKILGKCSRIFIETIGKNNDKDVTTSIDFAPRFCNKLGLSFKIQKLCIKLIRACEYMNFLNNISPQTLVSSIIQFISIEMALNIKIKSIAEECGTSITTITKTTKKISKNKIMLFNIVQQKL